MMAKINVNLAGIEGELTGIIHKCLNEMLVKLDIKEWVSTRIDRMIERNVNSIIEKKVYAFLEEAEIEVPKSMRYNSAYSNKITINEYIIKIIHDVAVDKASKVLKGLKITLEVPE